MTPDILRTNDVVDFDPGAWWGGFRGAGGGNFRLGHEVYFTKEGLPFHNYRPNISIIESKDPNRLVDLRSRFDGTIKIKNGKGLWTLTSGPKLLDILVTMNMWLPVPDRQVDSMLTAACSDREVLKTVDLVHLPVEDNDLLLDVLYLQNVFNGLLQDFSYVTGVFEGGMSEVDMTKRNQFTTALYSPIEPFLNAFKDNFGGDCDFEYPAGYVFRINGQEFRVRRPIYKLTLYHIDTLNLLQTINNFLVFKKASGVGCNLPSELI